MAFYDTTLQLDTLTPLHWIGIVAALVTAGVHLALGISIGGGFGIAFVLAAIGFLAGIAAVLLEWRRRLIYLLGIPYTAGQIVLWFLLNDVPPIEPSHAIDKIAQLILVAVLIALYRREV